jgi:hypothetical protein
MFGEQYKNLLLLLLLSFLVYCYPLHEDIIDGHLLHQEVCDK